MWVAGKSYYPPKIKLRAVVQQQRLNQRPIFFGTHAQTISHFTGFKYLFFHRSLRTAQMSAFLSWFAISSICSSSKGRPTAVNIAQWLLLTYLIQVLISGKLITRQVYATINPVQNQLIRPGGKQWPHCQYDFCALRYRFFVDSCRFGHRWIAIQFPWCLQDLTVKRNFKS